MLNKIIRKISFAKSVRLGKKEKLNAVNEYGDKSLPMPPIFIIGIPRCGSTVFYQALTNAIDVVYFTNYAMKQYPSILRGMKQSFEKYGDVRHSYKSSFGDTEKSNEPSEGSYFWYQWFPFNRHYLTRNDINEESKKEIYSIINALLHQHKKPLVIKNLNCGQRIDLLQDIFKDVLFIHLKRSPAEVIRSMYRAKKHRGIKDNEWFSVKSKNYDSLKSKSGLDQLCAQYKDLNDQMMLDLKNIPAENHLSISYESFCNDPESILKQVHQFLETHIEQIHWQGNSSFEKIHKTKFLLDTKQEEELAVCLEKYGLHE